MRRILSVVCFLFLGLAGSAGAQQPAKARQRVNPENEIAGVEARRFRAMTEGDLAALQGMLGDELTYTHANGWTQTKSEFIEMIRSKQLQYVAIEPANIQVRSYGTAAVATGRAELTVRSEGKEESLQVRFIDVYVRRRGRWQMVAWQSTRLPEKSP